MTVLTQDDPAFLPSRDLCRLNTLDVTSREGRKPARAGLLLLSKALGLLEKERNHHSPVLINTDNLETDQEEYAQFTDDGDSFELRYSRSWLTRLVSELSQVHLNDDLEYAEIEGMCDSASELLSLCAGKMASGPSTKLHTFGESGLPIRVALRDATLMHDSLGTHTWGAAPILSQLILPIPEDAPLPQRILELGAGTGLVGLALAQWIHSCRPHSGADIFATDYHPVVMQNLEHNASINGWDQSGRRQESRVRFHVRRLDWQLVHAEMANHPDQHELGAAYVSTAQTIPNSTGPNDTTWEDLEITSPNEKFDMLIVADCVYDPAHPFWIRSVAERCLRQPEDDDDSDSRRGGGVPVMHVMIPLRHTHKAELEAVYKAFDIYGPDHSRTSHAHRQSLQIFSQADYEGYDNFGSPQFMLSDNRDKEARGGSRGKRMVYRYLKIGWAAQAASR